jgi:hypothetical protein
VLQVGVGAKVKVDRGGKGCERGAACVKPLGLSQRCFRSCEGMRGSEDDLVAIAGLPSREDSDCRA